MPSAPLTPDDFPPIGGYGFLSDCHTSALVSFDGAVEWLCLPRFDSPSVFAALLDRGAGHLTLRPRGVVVPISRRYIPGTLVIETTWVTDTGWMVVHDALSIASWTPSEGTPIVSHESDQLAAADDDLHRRRGRARDGVPAALRLRALRGAWSEPARRRAIATRARRAPSWSCAPTWSWRSTAAPCTRRPDPARRRDRLLRAELGRDGEARGPRSAPEARERLDLTEDFWRLWLRHGEFPDHPWRIHLQRSALVLKGLTYTPTGAIVAAATTSLPETPGGERNWDYRYTWIRDSTFSLWALHTLGFDQEARDFMRFILTVCRDHPELQIMYGIGHERELTESTLDHLSGLRRGEAGADRQRRLRPAPERRLGRPPRLRLPARKSARAGPARRPTAN